MKCEFKLSPASLEQPSNSVSVCPYRAIPLAREEAIIRQQGEPEATSNVVDVYLDTDLDRDWRVVPQRSAFYNVTV